MMSSSEKQHEKHEKFVGGDFFIYPPLSFAKTKGR